MIIRAIHRYVPILKDFFVAQTIKNRGGITYKIELLQKTLADKSPRSFKTLTQPLAMQVLPTYSIKILTIYQVYSLTKKEMIVVNFVVALVADAVY